MHARALIRRFAVPVAAAALVAASGHVALGAQSPQADEIAKEKAAKAKTAKAKAGRGVVVTSAGSVSGQLAAERVWAQFGTPGNTFAYVASEFGFENAIVKGAPYSAEVVTETTQDLCDGNRIVRRTVSKVFRDGEGRTRREQRLGAIGPWVPSGEPRTLVTITDPVAGASYSLDVDAKTARKVEVFYGAFGGAAQFERLAPMASTELFAQANTWRVTAGPDPGEDDTWALKREPLGRKPMEGVDADGTRTTKTIPVGAVGNERPIDLVYERWVSPDLHVVVMTRSADPRTGETTYKLTKIDRSEPAHELFTVPADFKLLRSGEGMTITTSRRRPDDR